jgi:hypothetical protein
MVSSNSTGSSVVSDREFVVLLTKTTNSVFLVRKRTIPTERPPLVGEVSANFSGWRMSRRQRNESPPPLVTELIIPLM